MTIYPNHHSSDHPLAVQFQQILFWGFLYTFLGGAIRKWVLTGGMLSNIILLGQLLVPLVIAWQHSRISSGIPNPFRQALILMFVLLALMAANPLNNTIMHGALGIIIHSGFWCLLFIYLKQAEYVNIKQLDNFLLIILGIQAVIATYQYSMPGDHFINRFASGETNEAAVGSGIRTSGTFSYIGGFQAMVIFYGFFTWSLIKRYTKPTLYLISMVLTLYLALLNGSRGSFITAAALIAMGIFENRHKAGYLIKYMIGAGTILLFLGVFGFTPLKGITSAWENFDDRLQHGIEHGEMEARIEGNFFSAFSYHGNQPFTGAGLGSTYQGANQVFGVSQTVKQYGYMEDETERIVFEGGYPLFILRIVFLIMILSAMKIPIWSKWALFFLFINAMLIFNTYMTFFVATGLIWINNSSSIDNE